jgi:lipopolysaccharide transport system permease protein
MLPVLALWTLLSSLGIGWFLAAINVKYRDVRYALPFFIQLLVFVSPVIYPAAIFRKHAWVLALNPMTGVIESARYMLLGAGTVNATVILTSLGTSVVFILVGYLYFQEVEKTLTDVL